MKIAVALSLLAALCIVYADYDLNELDKLKAEIKNMSNSVENDLLDLKNIRYQIEEVTSDNITEKWRSQDSNFREFITILVTRMRKEVNTAREKGVDAQYCFDANNEGLKIIAEEADKEAAKCKEASYDALRKNLAFIDEVKKRGDMVKDDLESVEVRCHSNDEDKVNVCLSTELQKIEKDVQALKDDVEQVENAAKTAADYVILEATKCFEHIYDLAHFTCEASGRSHTGCVKKAIENAGKTRRISPKIIQ